MFQFLILVIFCFCKREEFTGLLQKAAILTKEVDLKNVYANLSNCKDFFYLQAGDRVGSFVKVKDIGKISILRTSSFISNLFFGEIGYTHN